MTDSLTFLDSADLLPDIPAATPSENLCEVAGCNAELVYGGKGRRPKRCPEHKRSSAPAATPRATSKSVRNDSQARAAAAALSQVNGLLGMGLMLAPMPYKLPATASALASAAEGFEEAAYNALLTDPKLCSLILKAGTTSGKVSLLIAYAMLAAAVIPVGIVEFRENVSQPGAADE